MKTETRRFTLTQAAMLKDVYRLLCEIRDCEPEPDVEDPGRLQYAGALGSCQGKAEIAIRYLDAIVAEDR